MLNHREKSAVAKLRHCGVIISVRRGHARNVSFDECYRTATHGDLQHLVGLERLEGLDLYGTPIDDESFGVVRSESLRSLNLNCTEVTDRAIERISSFPCLTFLGLMDTAITDTAVEFIILCQRLTQLRLDGSHVSPEGIRKLCKHLPLEKLWIDGVQASESCLNTIATLPTLREVNLVGAYVTDTTMRSMLRFHDLRSLSLIHTTVTDDGLANLNAIRGLEAIALSHSDRVTDGAIKHLQGFDRMRHIWVVGTRLTNAGKAQLRSFYPMATVGP